MKAQLPPRSAIFCLAPILALMALVFLFPILLMFETSLYRDGLSFDAYFALLTSVLFRRVLLTTLQIAMLSSALAVALAYPVAAHLARQPPQRRALLLTLVLLPLWTSILVKSYAFTVLLGHGGLLNEMLRAFGLPEVQLLFNRTGVVIGIIHYLIPFAVFPILTNLLAQDQKLKHAAKVMGSGPFLIFARITFPLSLPGVLASFVMAIVLSFGMLVTPALLGGRQDIMIANLIDFYTRESLNWPMASAIAVVLLIASGLFITVLSRLQQQTDASA